MTEDTDDIPLDITGHEERDAPSASDRSTGERTDGHDAGADVGAMSDLTDESDGQQNGESDPEDEDVSSSGSMEKSGSDTDAHTPILVHGISGTNSVTIDNLPHVQSTDY